MAWLENIDPLKIMALWKYEPPEIFETLEILNPWTLTLGQFWPPENTEKLKIMTSWKCRPLENFELLKILKPSWSNENIDLAYFDTMQI